MKNVLLKLMITASLIVLVMYNLSAQQVKPENKVEGIKEGSTVENFTALDQFGKPFELKKALLKGPVVIIFYRGQWCPMCNKHLKTIQDSLELIKVKNATVIAISPEKQEFLTITSKKTGASFTLLHDADYKIAKAFDVVFKPEEKVIAMYNERLGANLETAHSDNSVQLPIPATYIIGQDAKVVWRHFNPDYKVRASVKQILTVLDTINPKK